MDINLIIENLNNGATLDSEATRECVSKRTIQRRLKENGYSRKDGKYILDSEAPTDHGASPREKKKTIKKVSRSYVIEEELATALRLKAAIENIDQSDIVNDALQKYIEEKYFNLSI